MWLNMLQLKLEDVRMIFPNQFQTSRLAKNSLRDNKHDSLHLTRKFGRIFVDGHYLFLKAHSFPRATRSENYSRLRTDNFWGHISTIFWTQVEAIVYISLIQHKSPPSVCTNRECFLNQLIFPHSFQIPSLALLIEGNGCEANKDAKIYVGRSTTLQNLFFCTLTLRLNYVTNTFLLVSSSVRSKQLLCFVQGQGQTTEQKDTTKNFFEFHKAFPSINYNDSTAHANSSFAISPFSLNKNPNTYKTTTTI